jgi:hypothetical protein
MSLPAPLRRSGYADSLTVTLVSGTLQLSPVALDGTKTQINCRYTYAVTYKTAPIVQLVAITANSVKLCNRLRNCGLYVTCHLNTLSDLT